MLIYGVSVIFAHKKTITQFLQPMIEQVLGDGGEDVPLFLGQFFRATIFLCRFFFSIHRCLYFGQNLPIFTYLFTLYYVYLVKKAKQCFGHKIFVMYN